MALYHLSARIVSASRRGGSPVATAAYIAREKLHQEYCDRDFDYSAKADDLVHAELVLPKGAPAELRDREKLWNAAVNAEPRNKGNGLIRSNARFGREFEVALPVELSTEQQIEVVREFVRKNFVDHGLAVDWALHNADGDNPHAHILVSARTLEKDGFGEKDKVWNQKWKLLEQRQAWADVANRALERAGHEVRIDHRSHEARGIRLTPGRHVGPSRASDRMAEQEAIQRKNAKAIVEDPSIAIEAITSGQATFSRTELGRWVNGHTADRADYERVFSAVMNSAELVVLKDGRMTSHEMVKAELGLVDAGRRLSERADHGVSERYVSQALARHEKLSDEQREMVRHVVGGSDVALVEGAAGAGKSYALSAAREAWEAGGYRVRGAALSGMAAEGLAASAGISAWSLASWETAWKYEKRELGRRDVLVIDEAGMVGTKQLGRVLAEAEKRGAKVLLVGDTHQLQAIEAGAALRLLCERHGKVELLEVHRHEHEWQWEANHELRSGDAEVGLHAYADRGFVAEHERQNQALLAVARSWDTVRREGGECAMFAHRRVDVAELNRLAREYRRENGELGKDHELSTANGKHAFARGDRIVFGKPDRELGVINGTTGTVEHIRGKTVSVRLDDERQLVFSVKDYNHIVHGYASTIHKGQGRTVDRAVVLASKGMDRELAYVALSRHRKGVELHWDRETFGSQERLFARLGRSRQKDNVLDMRVSAEVEARAAQKLAAKIEEKAPRPKWDAPSHAQTSWRPGYGPGSERERLGRLVDQHQEAMAVWESWSKAVSEEQVCDAVHGAGPGAVVWTAKQNAGERLEKTMGKIQLELAGAHRDAGLEPTTAEKVLMDERPVRDVRHALDLVKHQVESSKHKAEQWAKENRALALFGRRPFAKKIEEAERKLKVEEKKLAELKCHPDLKEKAIRVAAEHNAKIKAGKMRVLELEPALKVAEKAENELAKVRSRDRDLGRKLGLELGRDRDHGMER